METGTTLLAALDAADGELEQTVAVLGADGVTEPEHLRLGEGDRHLLALCPRATGAELLLVADCPECGERSEFALSPEAVPPASPRSALLGPGGGLREPTYADLRSLPTDPAAAVDELLARCVVGSPSRPPEAGDFELVDDSLSGPVVINCSDCGVTVAVDVDLEQLVLERLARRAAEVDREIHLVASTYQWSLGEIESLSDGRRHAFAELVLDAR